MNGSIFEWTSHFYVRNNKIIFRKQIYLINQHGLDKIESTPKFLLVTYFHKEVKQNLIKHFILALRKPLLRLTDPLIFRIVYFFESNSSAFLFKFALEKSDIFLSILTPIRFGFLRVVFSGGRRQFEPPPPPSCSTYFKKNLSNFIQLLSNLFIVCWKWKNANIIWHH